MPCLAVAPGERPVKTDGYRRSDSHLVHGVGGCEVPYQLAIGQLVIGALIDPEGDAITIVHIDRETNRRVFDKLFDFLKCFFLA